MEIQTPTPGFAAAIYGSDGFRGEGPSAEGASEGARALDARGWTQLAAPRPVKARTTISFNPQGTIYRYYLVWITALPPGRQSAEVSELTLFR
jgi:hypothetical protein